ncbi:MAG TPA: EutN/CcmL family microcompartment protein [Ignavibacteriaceae bacterium]|nr:EutN/CcmL family microcompartment protein [Ignavibacteriaceae bacterium]
MILAKVRGNIVSTQKDLELKGHKLMIVRPVDLNGEFIGQQDIVALDLLDSGIGDTVLIVQEGDAVQQILGHQKAPVHTIINAIVDKVDYKE